MLPERRELYLLRHGQTTAGNERIIGVTDAGLSQWGKQATESLLASCSAIAPACVYASALKRSRQTAGILNAAWQAPVISDENLNEMDFGDWENLTWDQAHARDPETFDSWANDWASRPAPGGECFNQVIERCRRWLDPLEPHASPVVVVAHGGSLRAILALALHLPIEHIFDFQFDHARVSKLEIHTNHTRLAFLNCPGFR